MGHWKGLKTILSSFFSLFLNKTLLENNISGTWHHESGAPQVAQW